MVDDVRAFLAERIEGAVAEGVDEERIWVDPGIGFGKTVEHNLELTLRLGELRELGRPIVVRQLAEELHRKAHRGTGGRSGSGARSPRACSPTRRAPRSCASTTPGRCARR